MLACLVYFLGPLFWLFVASTKSISDLFSSFGLWFSGDFHLVQNIRDLLAVRTLDGGTYLVWMRNSLLYSVTSAVVAGAARAAAGYGFAKYSFRGRDAAVLVRARHGHGARRRRSPRRPTCCSPRSA